MKKILAFLTVITLTLTMASCGSNVEQVHSTAEAQSAPAEVTSVTMKFFDASGNVLAENTGDKGAALSGNFTPEPGYKVMVSAEGTNYVWLEMFGLSKALVYLGSGTFEFIIPTTTEQRDYPNNTFKNSFIMTATVPTADELKTSKVISLNPYDLKSSNVYPHAVANNEYSNGSDPDFRARNAIDGFTQNTSHGKFPYQSWGPDRKTGLKYTVELGRECYVTSVVLHIRADFPHDTNWSSCDICDDDGNVIVTAAITHTAEGQTFDFSAPVLTSKIVFDKIIPSDNNEKWVGFTEVSIIGYDNIA